MYPHQIERLTTALEGEKLGALVATSPENVFYVTGYRGPSHAHRLAVWTQQGSALVVPADDVAHVVSEGIEVDRLGAFGGAVCAYADTLGPQERRIRERIEARRPLAADALADALQALGIRAGRVGLDETSLTPVGWERLTARLDGITVVPAAAAFSAARRVKSPYEIECLARGLAIAEEALNEVLQILKPGVTEREAAAVYQREVLKREAVPSPCGIAFGERTWMSMPPPSERALKMGDLARFDVGASFKGYRSRVSRTAVMGEASDRQAAVVEAVQAGLEAAIFAVKPGATAGQVYDAAIARVQAAGLPGFQRGQVGQAIGLEPGERPTLEAGEGTTLEAGEVLGIEVPYLEIGWAGVALRDTVLVTTTGSRVLNRSVRGLVVLD